MLLESSRVEARPSRCRRVENVGTSASEWIHHSLFINCGGGETTVNGDTYEQDNDTASFFTSPNKNWAYSYSGGFLEGNYSSSDYIKNMTCGVSVAEAPLYDRARLSPVSLKYYAFCLREGKYNVTLKFAEIFYTDDTDYTSLRKRAFDIYIQDDKINALRDFNIKEQAGGPDKPITRSFTAVVNKTNPLLKIHMYWDGKGSVGYGYGPLISAIAVTPVKHFISVTYSHPSVSEFKVHDQKLHPLHITLLGIGSTFAVLLLLAFAWMVWLRSRNSPKIKVGEEKKGEEIQDKHVTLKELIDATGKFSDKNKIGTGSLGKVYKAELLGQVKTTVAVKKLSSHFKENIQKLKKEIKWLYELEHENLIKLFDYHIEKDLQILVYEYMENGSLEDALTTGDSNTRSLKFTWDTRFKMCLGIARGLEYLHEHRKLNIAHMNIKAVNILLDGDLNPKISDFGLAHLYVEEDQFKVIKSDVLQGYTAPEYFHGNFSNKGDVYSFGVILLEIVCWKKNVIKSHHGTELLVDKANKNHEGGNLEDMIDKTLQGVDTQQALTILQLAVKCTNIAPSVRPTMSQVVNVLLDKMKIDELFRPAPINVGEKIKGTRDLASAGNLGATSMEHIPMPSTSSPSPKTKDELEREEEKERLLTNPYDPLATQDKRHNRNLCVQTEQASESLEAGVGLSPPSPPRQHISQQLIRSLSQSSTPSQSQRMKGLFKSKPRTPADVVRQTRDLLIYAQRGGTDSRESKREEKTVELSKNIRELKCILYGNSESEPVSEACAQLTQEFFREDTLRLLITCLPKLNLEARKDATQVVANLQRGNRSQARASRSKHFRFLRFSPSSHCLRPTPTITKLPLSSEISSDAQELLCSLGTSSVRNHMRFCEDRGAGAELISAFIVDEWVILIVKIPKGGGMVEV
ncbi:hypothetical protein ACLB2K_024469 [Fragaria x ananassa]